MKNWQHAHSDTLDYLFHALAEATGRGTKSSPANLDMISGFDMLLATRQMKTAKATRALSEIKN